MDGKRKAAAADKARSQGKGRGERKILDEGTRNQDARNEGEGSRTAARAYNEAQQRFIRRGTVDEKAREAERDLRDREIRRELEHAEAIGRRHAAEEDPEVKRR